MTRVRDFLQNLFRVAVAAAHPAQCLVSHLPPPPPRGRLIMLAAGKAAGSMTEIAERHYCETLGVPAQRMSGLAVTRYGYGRPTSIVPVVEAAHPIPDAAGLAAADKALGLAENATADDLVLVLLSGGASANWTAPAAGLTLADKQATTQALLRCGATIGEINTVRKHLSRIKGGRLAARAFPAPVVTLAISDVPGDDPAVIGSGPTVADPSTLGDARAIIARHRLDVPPAVQRMLADPSNETPKASDPSLARSSFQIAARPADAFRAAEQAGREAGYDCVMLGDSLEGEAREVAAMHAGLALEARKAGTRSIILSGGELTVTLAGHGRGGPNQEYALALAVALDGQPGIVALAADTDGTDGGAGSAQDPAGAMIDPSTCMRARRFGLDPAAFLANNDSTTFFQTLGDLLSPGPTYTNVNDFRAILIDTP